MHSQIFHSYFVIHSVQKKQFLYTDKSGNFLVSGFMNLSLWYLSNATNKDFVINKNWLILQPVLLCYSFSTSLIISLYSSINFSHDASFPSCKILTWNILTCLHVNSFAIFYGKNEWKNKRQINFHGICKRHSPYLSFS